jgi:iron complex transport system substrate-binding protein
MSEETSRPQGRIVSLLPAATEIVAALGIADRLVGRSHECDEPPGVATLPPLTAPRIDPAASSREIHEQVGRAIAGHASSQPSSGQPSSAAADGPTCGSFSSTALYTLDIDTLAALRPDIILTQAACDVCAIAAADVEAAVRRSGVPTRVVPLSPTSLADVFADILTVGTATGTIARAREVVARLQARVDSIACRTQTIVRAAGSKRPRLAVVEWLDPPMAAGNWVPELVRLAGGDDVLGRSGGHSHWISWDDVAAADPDVVVLTPCGFPLDRVVAEAGSAAVRPRLEPLRAFREGRCFAIDGHHLFNRPGPRLVDSLEVLAELLHPGAFRFPHTRRLAAAIGTAALPQGRP